MTTASTQLRALEGEIELHCKATTPGPWYVTAYGHVYSESPKVPVPQNKDDRKFIAFARTALPQLLTIAKELEKALSESSAEVPEGYRVAKDSLAEQVKLMTEGLRAFQQDRDSLRTENATLKRRLDEAMEIMEATVRLRECKYIPWGWAGGPNECEHGYAEGIACHKCDLLTVKAAITRITEIDKL